MRKLLRVLSTLIIIIGILFLLVYLNGQNADRLSILSRPSYYVEKSLWLMFIAGIVILVTGVLSSFFSWFKALDKEKEEALQNPGYVSAEDIHEWVGGSSADLPNEKNPASPQKTAEQSGDRKKAAAVQSNEMEHTELLTECMNDENVDEHTELLTECLDDESVDEHTELLTECLDDENADEHTELLTECLDNENVDEHTEQLTECLDDETVSEKTEIIGGDGV